MGAVMGTVVPIGWHILYSNGAQYALNGWYILDGHKAPVWWDGKGYVFGGA